MSLGRKRSRSTSSHAGSSKRLTDPKTAPARPFDREGSPSKNVHFGKNLIQGRTLSDPTRRPQSPTRSALRKPEDDIGLHGGHEGPSAQLQAEYNASVEAGRDACLAEPNALDTKKKTEVQSVNTSGRKSKATTNNHADTNLVRSQPDKNGQGLPAHYNLGDPHGSICAQMDYLKDLVQTFAQSFKAVTKSRKEDVLLVLFRAENRQLIRYIGCLSMGGKSGVEGWRTLLSDTTCCQALVSGIVGRALKENVFSELCFGSDPKLAEILAEEEQHMAQTDGFHRSRRRAGTLKRHEKELNTPSLRHAVARITLQLERLLSPLWELGSTATAWRLTGKRGQLAGIVDLAAAVSHSIRKDGSSVYYWAPTFKDEEFEPARMECFNLYDMVQASPYDKKTENGVDQAVLQNGHEHESEAIVRIVCFPGLVAYQQGGGDFGRRELAQEEQHDRNIPKDVQRHRERVENRGKGTLTGDEGFRTRTILKSVVLLQWGKQRLLTKEAGTSAHLDAMRSGNHAKYESDYEGFLELYDLFLAWNPEPGHRPSRGDQPQQGTVSVSLLEKLNPLRRSQSPSGVSVGVGNVSLQSRRGGTSWLGSS